MISTWVQRAIERRKKILRRSVNPLFVMFVMVFALHSETVAATVEPDARLLTRAEGEALVDLALEHPVPSRRLDCSHLVHQVLTDAGLTYTYATSFEIFAGVSQFRRVSRAQPGDLIVWPGHVGLVVDEGQGRFFSATRRGIRTDEYNKNYWRRRGHPRFYRYVVGKDAPLPFCGTCHAQQQGIQRESEATEN